MTTITEPKTDEQKTKEIADFLAKAFCITGNCKFISAVITSVQGKKVIGNIFKLTDEIRGTFYVTISK